MARYIRVTQEVKDKILSEVSNHLTGSCVMDESVMELDKFLKVPKRATIHFAEIAWLKMQALIASNPDEVAWHGLARRSDDSDDYYIDDLLVYPQEVSGAQADTDQEEYTRWLADLSDNVFNRVRMQGHSHVNMGVSPSSKDTEFYSSILQQLTDDTFYIFMIWNKRKERWVRVYDMTKNIMFETGDCDILIGTEIGVSAFLKDAEKKVRKITSRLTPTETLQDDDDVWTGHPIPWRKGRRYK